MAIEGSGEHQIGLPDDRSLAPYSDAPGEHEVRGLHTKLHNYSSQGTDRADRELAGGPEEDTGAARDVGREALVGGTVTVGEMIERGPDGGDHHSVANGEQLSTDDDSQLGDCRQEADDYGGGRGEWPPEGGNGRDKAGKVEVGGHDGRQDLVLRAHEDGPSAERVSTSHESESATEPGFDQPSDPAAGGEGGNNHDDNKPPGNKGGDGGNSEGDQREPHIDKPHKILVSVSELSSGRDLGHDRRLTWLSERSPMQVQNLVVDPGIARVLMERVNIAELIIGFHQRADATYTKTHPSPYEIRYFGPDDRRGAVVSFDREEQARRIVHARRLGESSEAAWARQLSRAVGAVADRIGSRAPDAQNEDSERTLGQTLRHNAIHVRQMKLIYRLMNDPRWQIIKSDERS